MQLVSETAKSVAQTASNRSSKHLVIMSFRYDLNLLVQILAMYNTRHTETIIKLKVDKQKLL